MVLGPSPSWVSIFTFDASSSSLSSAFSLVAFSALFSGALSFYFHILGFPFNGLPIFSPSFFVILRKMADPPQGNEYVWPARLAPSDINLNLFVSNDLCTILVALQPLDDSKIRLQHAKVIYENLKM